jgi:hypothetical protein
VGNHHFGENLMTEEDPDLLAGENLDQLRGRNPMSERFRLWEELENAKYQNNLLAQKCRELEKENFHLAANQCHSGYAGEYGHHRCKEIDRLTEERDEARREVMLLLSERSSQKEMREEYRKRGWSYLLSKENNNE